MSECVVTILGFCKDELKMREFVAVGAKIRFKIIINILFVILNSINLLQFHYKKHLSLKKYESIETSLNDMDKYISSNTLQFLPMYKISQDHIELFFGCIHSHGGYNNNPTSRQFQAAYKKILVHVEVRESFRENCIPLEELRILKCPVQQINESSRDYRALGLSENYYSVLDNTEHDHDYLPNPTLSEFTKYIVTYIAGYTIFSLKKAYL